MYVIYVDNKDSSRTDIGYLKYWVDSCEKVAYRGLVSVLHIVDGDTDIFITDKDRTNWIIKKIDSTLYPKPLDFVSDKYSWVDGTGAVLNSTYVEYRFTNSALSITNTVTASFNAGVGNGALNVSGGGFFDQNVIVRRGLQVSENFIVPIDLTSAVTINSTLNSSLNSAQTAIADKGALYIKGGLAVEQDIVANNIYVKGSVTTSAKIRVTDPTNAGLLDASIFSLGGLSITKDIRCLTGSIYGSLIGNVTGNVSGTAGAVAWNNVTSKPSVVISDGATYNVNLASGCGITPALARVTLYVNISVSAYTNQTAYDPAHAGGGSGSVVVTFPNGYPTFYRVIATNQLNGRGSITGVSPAGYQWSLSQGSTAIITLYIGGNNGASDTAYCAITVQYFSIFK